MSPSLSLSVALPLKTSRSVRIQDYVREGICNYFAVCFIKKGLFDTYKDRKKKKGPGCERRKRRKEKREYISNAELETQTASSCCAAIWLTQYTESQTKRFCGPARGKCQVFNKQILSSCTSCYLIYNCIVNVILISSHGPAREQTTPTFHPGSAPWIAPCWQHEPAAAIYQPV